VGILIFHSYAVLFTDNTDVSTKTKWVIKRWDAAAQFTSLLLNYSRAVFCDTSHTFHINNELPAPLHCKRATNNAV
jgi:hypothetical protein